MSSWVALQRRISFTPGHSVLILGATGSAGRLAIQVAKHLGARKVVAAGRNADILASLPALGADDTVSLAADPDQVVGDLATKAADVDVVLDYLWGQPTEKAIMPLLMGRPDRSRLLVWIQIGAVAGPSIDLPSVALRQANIQIPRQRTGIGDPGRDHRQLAVSHRRGGPGSLSIDVRAVPLAQVEQIWTDPTGRSTTAGRADPPVSTGADGPDFPADVLFGAHRPTITLGSCSSPR